MLTVKNILVDYHILQDIIPTLPLLSNLKDLGYLQMSAMSNRTYEHPHSTQTKEYLLDCFTLQKIYHITASSVKDLFENFDSHTFDFLF